MFFKICVFLNLIGEKSAKTVFSREKKMMHWIQSNILVIFLGVSGIDYTQIL